MQRHGRGQRGGGAAGARERVLERKKIQQETNDFLEVMHIPKPTTQEEWRAVWKEVGTLLAAKHFITHTPVPVMDLPIATVVDSKEHLRFRAMCDERISSLFLLRSSANSQMSILQVGALRCFGFFCGSEGGMEMQH